MKGKVSNSNKTEYLKTIPFQTSLSSLCWLLTEEQAAHLPVMHTTGLGALHLGQLLPQRCCPGQRQAGWLAGPEQPSNDCHDLYPQSHPTCWLP